MFTISKFLPLATTNIPCTLWHLVAGKSQCLQSHITYTSASITIQHVEMPQGKLPDHDEKTEHAGILIELKGYSCESRQKHQLSWLPDFLYNHENWNMLLILCHYIFIPCPVSVIFSQPSYEWYSRPISFKNCVQKRGWL